MIVWLVWDTLVTVNKVAQLIMVSGDNTKHEVDRANTSLGNNTVELIYGMVEYSTDQAYNSETPARHSTLMERRRRDISVTDLGTLLTRYTRKCRDNALAALGCSWKQEDDPKGLAGDSSFYTMEEVRNMENNRVLMVGTSEPSCPGLENFSYRNLPWNEIELDFVRAEYIATVECVKMTCMQAITGIKRSDIEE